MKRAGGVDVVVDLTKAAQAVGAAIDQQQGRTALLQHRGGRAQFRGLGIADTQEAQAERGGHRRQLMVDSGHVRRGLYTGFLTGR
jgi:hypothetical protein